MQPKLTSGRGTAGNTAFERSDGTVDAEVEVIWLELSKEPAIGFAQRV